ncbi:MAG: prephenate dehydratase [Anaerolineae bacterium]|nr:prephenate dehydratase [Anaerolineae bacterium]
MTRVGTRVGTRVAFQGVAGAYSQEAVRQYFGSDADPVPCPTLEDMFPEVESGRADFAMLPVENAVAGAVAGAYELLLERDLRINAEVILRVRHMLLAAPGTRRSEVRRVRSHPQALAQCQRYLDRYGMAAEPAFDTAGSARDLAENPEPDVAVIASGLAAEMYGLEILDRGIEDFRFNYTRFFAMGTDDPPRAQRTKTSVVFSTRHSPGALYQCIGEFSTRNINLTKIESRPRLNQPWRYTFYLDFEGHCQDLVAEAALMGLLRHASFVKLLGSYPAATTPISGDDYQGQPESDSLGDAQ